MGRLRDRSSNVRKQAVQLLTFLLQCNPYTSNVEVEAIKEQYVKEKATLEEMLPKNNTEADCQKAAEEKAAQWYEIKLLNLKVKSQLSHGIPTKKLPQIITKVCKFTRNTAITQKKLPKVPKCPNFCNNN